MDILKEDKNGTLGVWPAITGKCLPLEIVLKVATSFFSCMFREGFSEVGYNISDKMCHVLLSEPVIT